VKEGQGRLRLSGNSTFSGNLEIHTGTLLAAHPNALGSTFRGTAVNNGAQLILEGLSIAGEYILLDSTNSLALDTRGTTTLGGILFLNRNSQVGPSSSSDGLIINGQVDGPGTLTKVGAGTLTLGGAANNTYAGETFVNDGTLLLNKPIAVTAIPAALEVGATDDRSAGIARNLNGYQIVGSIYVHSRGLYEVNGQEENTDALTMYGNAIVRTAGGYLYLKPGAPLLVYPGSNTTATLDGNLALM
jgi:autotransporter-associated beta strand protein